MNIPETPTESFSFLTNTSPNPSSRPTFTVTLAHKPTLSPTPKPPTATPIPTKTLMPAVLDCWPTNENRYIYCIDYLLNIEFEYPAPWGDFYQVLGRGGTSGYEYYYFLNQSPDQDWPVAGGISRDYSEGREGSEYDFAGNIQRICTSDVVCIEVEPQVFLVVVPRIEDLCLAGFTNYSLPYGEILIQLPTNNVINGFEFTHSVFSESAVSEIRDSIAHGKRKYSQ